MEEESHENNQTTVENETAQFAAWNNTAALTMSYNEASVEGPTLDSIIMACAAAPALNQETLDTRNQWFKAGSLRNDVIIKTLRKERKNSVLDKIVKDFENHEKVSKF